MDRHVAIVGTDTPMMVVENLAQRLGDSLCDQANHFAKFCPKKRNTHGQRKSKFVHEVVDTKHDEYVFVIDDNVCVESVDMSHDTICVVNLMSMP